MAFEWANGYDEKDWERVKKILATSVRLDFRALHGELHESLSPDQFVAIIGDKKVIGDPRVKTQHLLGASHWGTSDDGDVVVKWQARVAHQRHATEDIMSEVVNKGHGHGVVEHTYRKVDGAWKIVGVKPNVGWFEYDLFGTLNPPEGN